MAKGYIGHLDNPLSMAGRLFPEQILAEFNGGLFAVKEKIRKMNLVEIHFQLFEEIPSNDAEIEKLGAYVKSARKKGIEVIAHAPFLRDKNAPTEKYKPLNFDFVWPIVPEEYKKSRVMKIGENECFVKKAGFGDYIKLLGILNKLKIKILTMHVSKSGIVLNDSDWRGFIKFLRKIGKVAKKEGVKLAIETGGLHEEHIVDIIKTGCKINFDTAHYFLDMHYMGKNAEEANGLAFAAFKKFYKNIAVLHLSQTLLNYDSHLGLLDKKGVLTCNERILNFIFGLRIKPYIILETKPDKKAVEYVRRIVDG